MGLRYRFLTLGNKSWQIILGRNRPRCENEVSLATILSNEFKLRQQFPDPKNQSEINRQQAQDFLAANWGKIVRIFYSNPDEVNWRDDVSLPVFTNVCLEENKIIDFIAFGPDGRIFVFNFVPRNPNLPQDINNLLREMKLEPLPVTIVTGLISFTNKENNLILNIQ